MKKNFIPISIIMAAELFVVGCSTENDEMFNATYSELTAGNKLEEVARDYGVAFKASNLLPYHSKSEEIRKEMEELELLFRASSSINGTYKIQLTTPDGKLFYANQGKKFERKKIISRQPEQYVRHDVSFPNTESTYQDFSLSYTCTCSCSAQLFTYNDTITQFKLNPTISLSGNMYANLFVEDRTNNYFWRLIDSTHVAFDGHISYSVYGRNSHIYYGSIIFDYSGLCNLESGTISWMPSSF